MVFLQGHNLSFTTLILSLSFPLSFWTYTNQATTDSVWFYVLIGEDTNSPKRNSGLTKVICNAISLRIVSKDTTKTKVLFLSSQLAHTTQMFSRALRFYVLSSRPRRTILYYTTSVINLYKTYIGIGSNCSNSTILYVVQSISMNRECRSVMRYIVHFRFPLENCGYFCPLKLKLL